jgi:hypothetical protein
VHRAPPFFYAALLAGRPKIIRNNERPDSFRVTGARAALPQNCSPEKINLRSPAGNSTSVLLDPPPRCYTGCLDGRGFWPIGLDFHLLHRQVTAPSFDWECRCASRLAGHWSRGEDPLLAGIAPSTTRTYFPALLSIALRSAASACAPEAAINVS